MRAPFTFLNTSAVRLPRLPGSNAGRGPLGVLLEETALATAMHVMVNAFWEDLVFEVHEGGATEWRRLIPAI
jgi:hypothetical protein